MEFRLEAVITLQEKLLIEKTQTSSLSAYENYILGLNYLFKNYKEDNDIVGKPLTLTIYGWKRLTIKSQS